jgi:hypothetical protein
VNRAESHAPILAALAFAGVLGLVGSARANPFGYHEHDGFYLRFGGGISSMTLHRATEREGEKGSIAFEGDSSNIGGASAIAEVSIGATPLKKLVIAGSAIGVSLPSAQLRLGTGARLNLDSSLNFALFAPTADVFPDPGGGFHFGGGMGLAWMSASLPDDQFSSIGGLGVGVTLHIGYDLWVGDDWSVGAAGRALFARVNGTQSSSTTTGEERDSLACFALTITALYH